MPRGTPKQQHTIRLGTACLTAAVLVAVSVHTGFAADGIGVSFSNGTQLLAASDRPDDLPNANWNNLGGGGNPPLHDGNGVPVATQLVWHSGGAYDAFHTPATSNAATNRLFSGGLVGADPTVYPGVAVTGVPYPIYDVYIFAGPDTGSGNPLGLSFQEGANNPVTFFARSSGNDNSALTVLTRTTSSDPLFPTVGGEYVLIPGVTASSFRVQTTGGIPFVLSDNLFGLDIVPATELGDANADGTVGFADLLVLAQHYGQKAAATFAAGDFNADSGVSFDDLLILAQHYGPHGAPTLTTPAPEPAPAVLALAALLPRSRRTDSRRRTNLRCR